jgi:hypothetical protein
MKTEMSQPISLPVAMLDSLPRLEELPESNRQELIQALAALLLHDPQLRTLLEIRYEPEQ